MKMITKKTSFSIGLFFISCILFSQVHIKGKIINSEGAGIPEANIILSQKSISTKILVTNSLGEFTIENITKGKYTISVSTLNYEVYSEEIYIEKSIQLNDIQLIKNIEELIVLDDLELNSEEDSSTSVSFLQASKDLFQQTAAFQWGGFFFDSRGYNSDKSEVLFNGVLMNKAQNNEPLWRNWGGLNDITRYPKELKYGLESSENSIGLVGGMTNFSVRAGDFSKGGRISLALTNYSYTQRLMATYATGKLKKGWAFVASGSRRVSKEGIIDGTFYDSWAYFLAAEKRLNKKHRLNFITFGSPYRRSGNSPNTQEVYDNEGVHYNAYWGWQGGKKRIERIRETFEPVWMFSHDWKLKENILLQTTISYQSGKNSSSRLDRGDDQLTQAGYQEFLENPKIFDPKENYNFVASPSPIYYRYLPSYFDSTDRKTYDLIDWNNSLKYGGSVINRQINWDFLYQTNYWNSAAGLGAAYFLVEDINEDRIFNFNTRFTTPLTNRIMLNTNISYQHTYSNNYRELNDLLGGLPISNHDFFTGFDFNKLDRNKKVKTGDKFNYEYNLLQHKWNAYSLFQYTNNHFDYALGLDFKRIEFWREGKYLNEYDLNNSLGKSEKQVFNNIGIKGNIIYKVNGKNFIKINSFYQTLAPTINNTFINVRYLNQTPEDLKNSKTLAHELNYIYRGKKIKAKVSAYWTKVKDETDVQIYYLDDDGDATGFLYQSLSGIDTQHMGVELGLEYKLNSTLKIKSAFSIGDYRYTNNPSVITYRDGALLENELLETAYFKNYKVPGSPQRAYNLGIEYHSKDYWWLSLNGNILSDNYVSLNPGKHSESFIVLAPPNSQENIDILLEQERFSTAFFMNISIGKSWRYGRNRLLASLNVNNILNNTSIKTGGFEQGYLGSYDAGIKENQSENPKWGNRYWYQQGFAFFLNVIYKF